ncbi:MAG: prepilin-type N-terminal cleavage/methylation domain-containing protein [Bryobacterales bacterium]|nr:prepilin-type N-terminal cleavage/methylation domain-containing protein [Bryobacterales bacterium]
MRRGFTLLEMLVATTLMAIAVVGLLSSLSASLRNASRLTDHDRASIVAKRKMDELLLQPRLPRFQPIEGQLTPAADAGLTGGWKATVTPFEVPPQVNPGMAILERVECEIWWTDGSRRRTFSLEGYKTTLLQPEDIAGGLIRP